VLDGGGEGRGCDVLLPCRLLALTFKMAAIDLCHCHLNFSFFASFATFFGDCSSSVVGVLTRLPPSGCVRAGGFDNKDGAKIAMHAKPQYPLLLRSLRPCSCRL